MRLLTALLGGTLLVSAFLAPRQHDRRERAFPIGLFTTPDPRARVQEGEAGRQLGVAMSGYEALVRNHPDDLAAVRGRIRTGFRIGAVGIGQPHAEETVHAQVQTYLERRAELDPDGEFLRAVVKEWLGARLQVDWFHQSGFYACAATAIFLAARGDEAARDKLLELTRQGDFYRQFFPFARRYHPAWPAAEVLVRHYLEHGDLPARVEAAATLLDYNGLFGVGGELVDRFLPLIRSSISEMREQVHASTREGTSETGRATVVGMALLACRGDADELRRLAQAKGERELLPYAPFADTVRIARIWVGLEPFEWLGPLTVRYKDLDPVDQEIYYLGAAHRVARLRKDGGTGGAEIEPLLDLIEAAFDSGAPPLQVFAMEALLRLAPERGAALLARAFEGRGALAAYAGVLADDVPDRVSYFLPFLRSPAAEIATLGAVSLLDPPSPRVLQR